MAEPRSKARDSDRLDLPGRRSRNPFKLDADAFGSFAEGFARFMGTGAFLGWMTVFVICWVAGNLILSRIVGGEGNHWDPYPFILLNLVFSTQASYAAPLILLAQNRQEARDRVALEEDRRVAAQSRADMDFLAREIASVRASVGDLATRDFVRSELRTALRDLLAELDRRDEAEPEEPAAPTA